MVYRRPDSPPVEGLPGTGERANGEIPSKRETNSARCTARRSGHVHRRPSRYGRLDLLIMPKEARRAPFSLEAGEQDDQHVNQVEASWDW